MRLPWTIWLHIAAEMWRLLLLTTAVLVTVTAFAITVRYTAEGKLGPLDTLKFMGLAMVPMLQYVLPFAAGFGATLAYHRQTADNELTAAKASGVSHRALIVPALVTGLVLAGVLGVLNGNVIPRFLRAMETMIAEDAARIVAKTIDAGQPLEMGNRLVYADQVYHLTPDTTERGGPYEILLLTGVAAFEVDPKGHIETEVTASSATLAFFAAQAGDAAAEAGGRAVGGLTMVTLDLKNAQGDFKKMGQGQLGSQTLYFPIQGVFNDDPKYYTNREMAEIPGDPDRINVVDTRRRELAYRLAERQTMAGIEGSLKAQGQARLTDPQGRTFALRAAGLRWTKPRWELSAAPGSPIEVDMYPPGPGGQPDLAGRIQISARSAGIRSDIEKTPANRRLTLRLELENTSAAAGAQTAGQREKLSYSGLAPADNPLPDLLAMKSAELLEEAARRTAGKPDDFIDGPARDLRLRILKLDREVLSKQHERAAMSVACLVMVLAGALTAMRLASSLPLTVYLWSFFPALACVITVSAGQNTTHQLGAGGLILLWGGVVALGAYALGAFWLVRKH
jgi:lipopolysaccharide export LptBFGC system permease protein LptF